MVQHITDGDDLIYGYSTNDNFAGGLGNDTIYGQAVMTACTVTKGKTAFMEVMVMMCWMAEKVMTVSMVEMVMTYLLGRWK